ncbi:hypothetical protein E1B28_001955 [Marasmius oreades]|uniref:Serine/threonine-protein kinase n=1 Tax=Marasmius oreades TaxID=181124 RepID=A0A9P7V4G5_9AGAR|nr:uncharacterized protein E1B28_001955 [Marasmius oreades]KAG7100176.1 hypothetical protein E1B28_001955 [Marasmius oreades]
MPTNASMEAAHSHPYLREPLLYITNLPASISDEALAAHCRACQVRFDKLTIKREPDAQTVSGIMEFHHLRLAEKALATLQSRPLSGTFPPIHLFISSYSPENPPNPLPLLPRPVVMLVENLPPGYSESKLYDLFRPYGAIDWVQTRTSFGLDTGVVEFWNEGDAARAVEELRGAYIEGWNITIRIPLPEFLTIHRPYSPYRPPSAVHNERGSRGGSLRIPSTCSCLLEGRHYENIVLDDIIPGRPEQIHRMMFIDIQEKGFMDNFLRSNQGMTYIEHSPWLPSSPGSGSFWRTASYIKPLDNEPFNLKSTDCDIEITIDHEDFTDFTSTILSTNCLDVPSSRDFTIKTRICIMWENLGATRMIVTTEVEWSGPSYIKDIVERASLEGQKSYYEALHLEMLRYIGVGDFRISPVPIPNSSPGLEKDEQDSNDMLQCVVCGTPVEGESLSITEEESSSPGSSAMSDVVEEIPLIVERTDDIRRILALETGVNTLLALEDSLVPLTVDLLQCEIRATASEPGLREYRRKCTKCLRGLVNKHHVLPNSLFVNEIMKEGSHPLCGGGFSDIWKGTSGDQSVCLKVLRVHIQASQSKKDKIVREFYKETLLWTQLSHPNLLPFLGVNTTLFPQGFCLVSPWMVNGDIITFLELNPGHDKLTVIAEISAGMSYLHSFKIVHGDIKGANVLVDANARCHLADFGLAITTAETTALFNSTTSSMKGSLRWMAPELFKLGVGDTGEKPNELARDIYAYGCTVLEIITGKPPFPDLIDPMVMFQVAVNGTRPARPTAVDWCPDNVWALVQQCWVQQMHLRPRASDVHSYLERLLAARRFGIPWEQEFLEPVGGG